MVIQNRRDCDMQKSSSVGVCLEICSGQVLTQTNTYRCPFNGDILSPIGIENIDKLTSTERTWDISHRSLKMIPCQKY